ncbi:hypothetical protein MLD38_029861 [Melastoma candidum]|uniref:Uncharacterized protein n=1 Tax=Melastoma candidum TaxID=119954 RepID=A0ACB9N7C2_9MYRT|nr:hypothetical protein MLD38_029861 [Melastoma candidum]
MESRDRVPENNPPRLSSSTSNPPEKREWAELLGWSGEEAEKKIKEEMPRLWVQVVPADSLVTMDFNENRVRIYLNSSGKVARAPRVG